MCCASQLSNSIVNFRTLRVELSDLSLRQWLRNHCLAFILFQGTMNCHSGPATAGSSSPINPNMLAASLLPSLQSILQQNTFQRVKISKYCSCGIWESVFFMALKWNFLVIGGDYQTYQEHGAIVRYSLQTWRFFYYFFMVSRISFNFCC